MRFKKTTAAFLAAGMLAGYAFAPEFAGLRGIIDVKSSAEGGIAVSSTNFPDENFRSFISERCDDDGNGYLSDEEIASVKGLFVSNKGITTLEGVGYFKSLETLYCATNKLTSLDVSGNPALSALDCSFNQLTTIDVSRNKALTRLDCRYNQITSVDLSQNPKLDSVKCGRNTYEIGRFFKSYDLSQLPVGFNGSRASDWKGAEYDPETNSLINVSSSQITYSYSYDTAKGTESDTFTLTCLPILAIIDEETFPDANFTEFVRTRDTNNDGELSISECNSTTYINVRKKNIASLKGMELFKNITTLYCEENQLTALDLTPFEKLTTVWCNDNALTELDISQNKELKELRCYNNDMTTLDTSENPALTKLSFGGDKFTTIDLRNNTALESLAVSKSTMEQIDLSANTALSSLSISETNIKSLDLSGCTALKTLKCDKNKLEAIDVSNNTLLEELNCSNNLLKTLDVSKNSVLRRLECDYNPMITLKGTVKDTMTWLSCSSDQLTSLDISENASLYLSCSGNVYDIGEVYDEFDLAKLPEGFDPSRAYDWDGCVYDEETNTIHSILTDEVTYRYKCADKHAFFKLKRGYLPDFVVIDEAHFPDKNFREFVKRYDSGKQGKEGIYGQDNVLTPAELALVTEINISKLGSDEKISDLTGIEYFTELKTLNCTNNPLTTLDLTKNLKLETIYTDKLSVIYGKKGTYAETYAKRSKIKFIDPDSPDTDPEEPAISGTITVSGKDDTAEGVTVSLTDANGNTFDADVDGGDFSVSSLPDGTYTLTVSKSKYCPRDCTVTVAGGQMTGDLSVKLQKYGDIDNTGEINISDALQIVNFRNSKTSSFDKASGDELDYLKKLADINGDGTVNINDALQIVNFRNGKKSAFDDIA